ncbi:MAG: NHL repeat-containing protein [Candidatus Eremiobacteraeota bacterium]|nr:NHL repeat-containing protein [Candidatus Eremiobacteraeota bacterium]
MRRIAFGISCLALAGALAACSSNDTALSSGGTPGLGPNFGTGSIYITNSTQNAVSIYNPSPSTGATIVNQIGGNNTRLDGPQYDAFDSKKQLYVTNFNPGTQLGQVTVYASQATGNVIPLAQIFGNGTGIGSPRGVALDSTNVLYVANVGSGPNYSSAILAYAPGATGNVPPGFAIAGTSTGLNYPTGIKLDPKDNLFVANTGNGTITEYATHATGNVAPIAAIGGPNTGLQSPTGLSLDAQGNVYVADKAANAIVVFAAGSSGNVAPIRTIVGAATTLNNPSDVLVDKAGLIYVTNSASGNGTGAVLIFPATANGNVAPSATVAAPGNVVGLALSP